MRVEAMPWRRDLVLLAAAGVTGVGVPILSAGLVDGAARLWLYWLTVTVLNVGWLAVIHPIGNNNQIPGVTRRFWRAARPAGALFVLGDVTQLGYIAWRPETTAAVSGGPALLACASVGCGVVVVAMLTSPLGLSTRQQKIRFWLDTCTVLVAVAVFGSVLTGSSARADQGGLAEVLQLLIATCIFVVAAFGAVKLMLTGTIAFTRDAGMLGALSVAGGAVLALLGDDFAHARPGWAMGIYLTDMVLLLAAGRLQQKQVSANPGLLQNRRRSYSLLPYTAIGALYILLLVVLARHGLTTETWTALVGLATGTALVVLRQVLAFADNDRLLAQLRRSQSELEHALSQREELADRLRVLAHQDSLTGLGNRALFYERLGDALVDPKPQASVTVLLFDLDGFKPVNDRYGHAAGDALLREVGARLQAGVRNCDTVARLGGDEFGILLRDLGEEDIVITAQRLVESVKQPVSVNGHAVQVSASVGIATERDKRYRPDELVAAADQAMYAVKGSSKGAFRLAPIT